MIDAVVAGAGTGGTLSGITAYLKEAIGRINDSDSDSGSSTDSEHEESSWFNFSPSKRIRPNLLRDDELLPWQAGKSSSFPNRVSTRPRKLLAVLADPQGSGLYNKVKYGVMFSQTEAEGKRRRHQVDTVVEGIGLNRLTHNFDLGLDQLDDAVSVTDEEAVRMSRHLVLHDGLFLGSSSAVNCECVWPKNEFL